MKSKVTVPSVLLGVALSASAHAQETAAPPTDAMTEQQLAKSLNRFERGGYVQCEPSSTVVWTAAAGNAWTVPLGADIGRALKVGAQSLRPQSGADGLLKRPYCAPRWILRASVTFLFS